jgi:hypothetical protein
LPWAVFVTPPFGGLNAGACRSFFECVATIGERVESYLPNVTAARPPLVRIRTVVHRYGSIRIGCFGFCKTMVWPLRAARRRPVAARSSHRDTALAPPSVPARLIRCAGHC